MILEEKEILSNYLTDICQSVVKIGVSFSTCSDLISATLQKEQMAKTLVAAIVRENSKKLSEEKKIISDKGWFVKSDKELATAVLLSNEKLHPTHLHVRWMEDKPTPKEEVKSILLMLDRELECKLRLYLFQSYFNFDPVDSLLPAIQGTR